MNAANEDKINCTFFSTSLTVSIYIDQKLIVLLGSPRQVMLGTIATSAVALRFRDVAQNMFLLR